MMTWTFGISEVTTMPWRFEEDVARYGSLGAHAIEIWEKKLDADPGRRREQLRLPAANGLAVSSFQASVHALYPTHLKPEPQDFDARLAAFVATLEATAPFMPGSAFVLNTGLAKGGDVERAFVRTCRAYRELARRAESLGVRLALEPLNPLAMNEDTFVWNLEDAVAILDAVDHPALGICADIWNLAGQYDLRTRLTHCAGRIFLAQVSDWRRPRSFLDRLAVGDGALDFQPFLAGLRDASYDGPLVLEIFSQDVSDSLYDGDLRAVVTRSREALERHQRAALRAISQQTIPSAAVVK
jgi:sugar phosphate isomerase/epimerase